MALEIGKAGLEEKVPVEARNFFILISPRFLVEKEVDDLLAKAEFFVTFLNPGVRESRMGRKRCGRLRIMIADLG